MKLIYHDINKVGQVSPFDETLLQVALNADSLLLASPYIGLNSLTRIIEHAHEWRLLSDIEAWLQSGNKRHRTRCWDFIEGNIERIRHIPDLHAKVAIGNDKVFLGSANFTQKGLLGRTELSVLIDDKKLVDESINWFEGLWESASPPIIKEGDQLIEALNEAQSVPFRSRVKLTSTTRMVSSVLSESSRPSGFDIVATIAKAELSESERYLSLDSAFRHISDNWCSEGRRFTFAELLSAIAKLYPYPLKRDVWALVIQETTNHIMGGLVQDGFDRYCYQDGIFIPWQATQLKLTTFIDSYLSLLIDSLPVSPEYSYFPLEHKWNNLKVPTHHILNIQNYLIQIGFIIEHDVAGDIEQYSLDIDFDWPTRWQKFAKSKNAFKEKTQNKQAHKLDDLKIRHGDEFKEPSDYLLSLQHRKSIIPQNDPGLDALKDELNQTANILGISVKQLQEVRENALVEAFSIIKINLSTLKLHDVESIVAELVKHNMPPKLMQQFRLYKDGSFRLLKKKGQIRPSGIWVASHYLALYPKALQSWRKLF